MQRIFSVSVACAICMLLTARRGDASFASQAADVFRSIGEAFEDAGHHTKTEVWGSHVDVSVGERYIMMQTAVDAGKVTFKVTNTGSKYRELQIHGSGLLLSLAPLAPGETAKLTAHLQAGVTYVIATAQSKPTKSLEAELTVRPESRRTAVPRHLPSLDALV
jgi:hypothetical protein